MYDLSPLKKNPKATIFSPASTTKITVEMYSRITKISLNRDSGLFNGFSKASAKLVTVIMVNIKVSNHFASDVLIQNFLNAPALSNTPNDLFNSYSSLYLIKLAKSISFFSVPCYS
jgi:hypothetical protein